MSCCGLSDFVSGVDWRSLWNFVPMLLSNSNAVITAT